MLVKPKDLCMYLREKKRNTTIDSMVMVLEKLTPTDFFDLKMDVLRAKTDGRCFILQIHEKSIQSRQQSLVTSVVHNEHKIYKQPQHISLQYQPAHQSYLKRFLSNLKYVQFELISSFTNLLVDNDLPPDLLPH